MDKLISEKGKEKKKGESTWKLQHGYVPIVNLHRKKLQNKLCNQFIHKSP